MSIPWDHGYHIAPGTIMSNIIKHDIDILFIVKGTNFDNKNIYKASHLHDSPFGMPRKGTHTDHELFSLC